MSFDLGSLMLLSSRTTRLVPVFRQQAMSLDSGKNRKAANHQDRMKTL